MGVYGVRFHQKKKKGGSFGLGRQKWILLWYGLPKLGVIQCAKMQFQARKIAFLMLKLPQNGYAREKFAICMHNLLQRGKRGVMSVD